MNQRRTTAIAIACGFICALCVFLFTFSVQGEANAARSEALARYGGEQIEVLVATRDIAAGERVEASAVETRLWIADLLPEEAIGNVADAVGKTATTSILKGEVISAKRFERGRTAITVPSGSVAVSVPAKAVQAVGGAIATGMYIDVYSSGDAATTAIARDVLVIDVSVGESGSLSSSGSGWITLAIKPENVQEIIAAAAKTDLYFVLPGEGVDSVLPNEDHTEEDEAKSEDENETDEGANSENASSSASAPAPDNPQSSASSSPNSGESALSTGEKPSSESSAASKESAAAEGSATFIDGIVNGGAEVASQSSKK